MDFPVGPNERERLAVLHETGLFAPERDPELDAICSAIKAHFGVPICLVTLIGETRQLLKARDGVDLCEVPRGDAFCSYAILADDVFVVPDAQADERFRHTPLVASPPHLRFYAGAPLTYLAEVRLGALCVLDTVPRSFSRGDRAELAAFADQAMAVIARRSFASPKRRSPVPPVG